MHKIITVLAAGVTALTGLLSFHALAPSAVKYQTDCRANKEQNDKTARPEIANPIASIDSYDTIFLGYPIWWGDAPRIMSTFVEAHDFSGLTVIPFCTSGGSGIGRSGSNLASQSGSGNWLDGDRLDGDISEDELKTWISKHN